MRRRRDRTEPVDRFPEQNPNPVLRMSLDGRLTYANPASGLLAPALEAGTPGRVRPELAGELRRAADAVSPEAVEVAAGERTFSVLPVADLERGFLTLYGTDVTAARILERFPDYNPNPVLRMSEDGTLLYANPASGPVVASLHLRPGERFPPGVLERLRRSLDDPASDPVEVGHDGRTYSLTPVFLPEYRATNIYGTDITALRAMDKFPDENPNPVLRVTQEGRVQYANPASAPVRKALGAEVGELLPSRFLGRVRKLVASGSTDVLEVRSGGRTFELLVVSVYEFGFINLYGTDVTAAREVERANQENERLLLAILPRSIADRLRRGEAVIADRFDEMTVLFADLVGFTELSSRMSPVEVVTLLNRLFSAFDQLADEYGLEKIKTVGDAYMVVGGLVPDPRDDEAARVAEMGLAMIAEVARIRAESGLDVQIRVGMHIGPTVAGVIGVKRFLYDVWGDTVNTASRMETYGVPGAIQVTAETRARLGDRYTFAPRGTVEVKGKGPTEAYLLVGTRPTSAAAPTQRGPGDRTPPTG